jgi:hypothetical protein
MKLDAGPAAPGNGGMVRPVPGRYTLMWRVFVKCGEITPRICQARNFAAMITAAQCRSARGAIAA